jgi:hypothetical protein
MEFVGWALPTAFSFVFPEDRGPSFPSQETEMPEYRRAYIEGGTYFFTIVTNHRRPLFADPSNVEFFARIGEGGARRTQLQY